MASSETTRLADNLRFLTGKYRSISEFCLVVGINRQQFNKYLSRTVRPSARVRRKICDHFEIEPDMLDWPPEDFRAFFGAGAQTQALTVARAFSELRALFGANDERISDYEGYYRRYYMSFSQRGFVLRSLLNIEVHSGIGFFRCIERLHPTATRRRRATLFKYRGTVSFLRERIFLTGWEHLSRNEITHTVLYPTYANGHSYMFGIISGCSAAAMREPLSSRIVLERIEDTVDRRKEVAALGAYPSEHPRIPSEVSDFLLTPSEVKGVMRGSY
jgi:hypothetical protein